MKNSDSNLMYLQSKMKDIGIALFKPEIDFDTNIPNNIIQLLDVEDDGHIWFYTSCCKAPNALIPEQFYGYLDFYKKGTDCRIRVNGIATVAKNDEDNLAVAMPINSAEKNNNLILIRLKVMQAEIFENKPQQHVSFANRLKGAFQLFFQGNDQYMFN